MTENLKLLAKFITYSRIYRDKFTQIKSYLGISRDKFILSRIFRFSFILFGAKFIIFFLTFISLMCIIRLCSITQFQYELHIISKSITWWFIGPCLGGDKNHSHSLRPENNRQCYAYLWPNKWVLKRLELSKWLK